MKPTRLILIIFLLLYSAPTFAVGGTVDGNDWRAWPNGEQSAYIMGVMDGWHYVATVREKEKKRVKYPSVFDRMFSPVLSCMAGKPYTQSIAIIEKYLKDHPEEWHAAMTILIWVGLNAVCSKPKP